MGNEGVPARRGLAGGADGTLSVVARHLNGALVEGYAGCTAWRGMAACRIDPDLAAVTLGPEVELGHAPMGPGGNSARRPGART